MKINQIAGIVTVIGLMFLMGPFGQAVDLILGRVTSYILLGFTFGVFAVGSFFIIRMIRHYEAKKGQIEPRAVFVPCAVFLLMYIMASAFR